MLINDYSESLNLHWIENLLIASRTGTGAGPVHSVGQSNGQCSEGNLVRLFCFSSAHSCQRNYFEIIKVVAAWHRSWTVVLITKANMSAPKWVHIGPSGHVTGHCTDWHTNILNTLSLVQTQGAISVCSRRTECARSDGQQQLQWRMININFERDCTAFDWASECGC